VQITLVVAYTLFFLFLVRRIKFFHPDGVKPFFVSAVFLLKILAGCALGLIYTYYYTDRTTADTFKFFDDGKVLFDLLRTHPKHFFEIFTGINSDDPDLKQYYLKMNTWFNADVLFNDNRTLVRLNTIFNFFSLGYYYVHVVFINFISFTGLVALFRLFQSFQASKSKELFAGVMLLPSMLFWGSGLLKDGLLLFALGMLLYSIHKIIFSKYTAIDLVTFLFCLLLLMVTKLYVLILIFPGIVAWYWARKDSTKRAVILKFITSYTIYFILAFNIGAVIDKYNVTDLIYFKQKNFYVIAETTKAKSVIEITPVERSAWSIISHTPEAVVRVFLKPSVRESSSVVILMSAFENILILLVMLLCMVSFRRQEIFRQPVFYFSVIFVLLMFALIGLITPILGAMVRYKVPALPFLLFVFISMYDKEQFRKRFSFLYKPKR
jgi:hypothetical protein